VHRNVRLDFDDLHFERRGYSPMGAYGASKLANILWSNELSRRLEGSRVVSNALHPGVIASNFGQSGPGWMRFGVKLVAPFLTTPEKGARTTLHLATSPDVEGVTGEYWKDRKRVSPSRAARDPEAARRLWAVSEDLVARSAPKVA
jgi:NAD(P)-dependent dehydrogenase (short-subunit alcohol dehydrogenase family)